MKFIQILIIMTALLAACSKSVSETELVVTEPTTLQDANTVQIPITSDPAKAKLVHAYIKAYNLQDIDAMLALATDDLEWLSIDGADIRVGARGADKLRETVEPYFKNCPSCRSNIRWTKTTEDRVVALEDAVWDKDGKRNVQSSLSLYEFEGEKIKRVYYFPVESKPSDK